MIFSKTTDALASKALYQKLEKRYGLLYQSKDVTRSRRSWNIQGDLATHFAFTKAFQQSRSVIFGDHRLRLDHAAQLTAWLEAKGAPSNNTVWITNRFESCDQKILQRWLDGSMTDQTVMEQINRPPQPLTDQPKPLFWAWLYWVKKHQVPVVWIAPKGSLEKQAASFFQKCLKEHQQGRSVIGWTGYLPMAPCWSKHLPDDLLRVVLEQPSMHWKYAGKKNKPWLVRQSMWIRLDNTPMLSLECARLFQNNQSWYLSPDSLGDWVQKLWAHFEKEFQMPKPSDLIRIWHPFGTSFVMPRSISSNPSLKRFAEQRMARGENVVLPKVKWIIMMQLQAELLAEEAMHAFRLFGMTQDEYGPWVTVWEEAWGMFASLWVDPDRQIPEQGDGDMWAQAHARGYYLGAILFDLYHSGTRAKKKIKQMFAMQTTDENTAKQYVLEAQTWIEGQE